jgi:hypothetical protein
MTTFTTEDREAVIQGATGAQYQFVDTSPHATQVRQIVNNICRELQALSTVIISLQHQIQTQKEHEHACGK